MIPLRDNIPSKITPFITWLLIAANAYVFYLQISAGGPHKFEKFIYDWAVIPKLLFEEPGAHWHTLISAMFLHGGWMHIIGNMVFLYIFGDNVEERLGHFKFLVFYLLAGVIANFSQAYFSATSGIPLVGASGAIAAVLGSYFYFYPHAKVVTLIPLGFFSRIVEIPAFFFLGFWFLMQAVNSTISIGAVMYTGKHEGGVAWLAHAAGFLVGLLMSPVFGGRRSKYK